MARATDRVITSRLIFIYRLITGQPSAITDSVNYGPTRNARRSRNILTVTPPLIIRFEFVPPGTRQYCVLFFHRVK